MKPCDATNTRQRILNAVGAVVHRVGFARATLDEIIREAEVSKGGFLYHFPTKTDCFAALIDQIYDTILRDALAKAAEMPEAPGRMLKAYIAATLEWQDPARSQNVVGIVETPKVKKRIVEHRARHDILISDKRIPEIIKRATLLICSGLWAISQLSEDSPYKQSSNVDELRNMMFKMIDESVLPERD